VTSVAEAAAVAVDDSAAVVADVGMRRAELQVPHQQQRSQPLRPMRPLHRVPDHRANDEGKTLNQTKAR